MLRLRVFAPTTVAVDEEVAQVSVQAESGAFTMLPRHVDTVAVLESGLLSFRRRDGTEVVLAVDGGTVVKVGAEVVVSSPMVVRGDLSDLRRAIDETFRVRAEREGAARSALTRLDVDLVQRMMQLEEHRG